MEKLTLKEVIKGVPDRWKAQYPNGKEGKYEKLIAAKPLSKKKVDEIIGNDSWTRLTCESCDMDVKEVIILDGFEYPTYICKECLNKALTLLETK